jgi:hypothetical protein
MLDYYRLGQVGKREKEVSSFYGSIEMYAPVFAERPD